MSKEDRAASPEEISNWVRSAANTKAGRPGHPAGSASEATFAAYELHVAGAQSSLKRARLKTFVKMVKPFRGMFRNQGAVNDSLIEAIHHLAAQNQVLAERISDLRDLIDGLRRQVRHTPSSEERRNAGEIRTGKDAVD